METALNNTNADTAALTFAYSVYVHHATRTNVNDISFGLSTVNILQIRRTALMLDLRLTDSWRTTLPPLTPKIIAVYAYTTGARGQKCLRTVRVANDVVWRVAASDHLTSGHG